jgi:phosphoribosylanthranilate isomerase
MRTRVKICGITRSDCLNQAVTLGADAIGFNMFPESPRYLEVERAKHLMSELPGFVTSVGLFANESATTVAAKVDALGFDLLQFHGDESNEFCRQFGRPFIKVLRIKRIGDIDLVNDFPDAKGFLFDAHVPGLYGGTGQRIDPELIPYLPAGSILAGGLKPENVADAIAVMQPFAVDVSSGVEVKTGVKDPELLAKFFQAVETADRR